MIVVIKENKDKTTVTYGEDVTINNGIVQVINQGDLYEYSYVECQVVDNGYIVVEDSLVEAGDDNKESNGDLV